MSDWNAESYHRVSEPQREWGRKVLASLELEGDEVVMDAGCGTGRLTAELLERLPRGRVIALDASENMLEVARRTLAPYGDRVSFVRAELGEDELPSGVDVVFSTATFHWVPDHDALFRSIRAALVVGGRLHAQCGGQGNLARAHESFLEVAARDPYAAFCGSMGQPWNFAGVNATRRRLIDAGLEPTEVALERADTPFESREAYAEFARTVVLRPFLACLPPELHDAFVSDVCALAAKTSPPFLLDYVRLNLRARRA